MSACLSAVIWLSVSLAGGGHGGAHLAAVAGEHGAKGTDHVGGREQPAILGDEQQEILGQPVDLELFEDSGQRPALLLGAEHRALDQPHQVVEGIERLAEAVEIAGDLVQRLLLKGELEQRGGIAARNAGTGIYLACH